MRKNILESRVNYRKILGVSLIAIAFCLTAFALIATPVEADNGGDTCPDCLVSYWKLDGSAVDSYDENDGTLHNGPTWTTGQVNGALEFDGVDDYVAITDDTTLDIDDTLTVECWFNVDEIPGNNGYTMQNIISKDTNYEFHVHDNGKLYWWWEDSSNIAHSLYSDITLMPNTWYHVAVIYNESDTSAKMYINGNLENETTVNSKLSTNDLDLHFGKNHYNMPRYFDGEIDEVAVYDCAISENDVREHYLNGLIGLGICEMDQTPPKLDSALFIDDYISPNWYDQGTDDTATMKVYWTEDNPDYVKIMVDGIGTYYDNNPTGGVSTFDIPISGMPDGDYSITYEIRDLVGQKDTDVSGTDDEPLRLDNTGPVQTVEFGEPKDFYESDVTGVTKTYSVVGPYTPIWINSTDEGVGSQCLNFYIQRGNEYGDWDYTSYPPTTVCDGEPLDETEPDDGLISVKIYQDESCWHQIHYYCTDLLDNRQPVNGKHKTDFIVDADAPISEEFFDGPTDGLWIGSCTKKWINVTDIGCTDYSTGVSHVDWYLARVYDDYYEIYDEGTIYDGDPEDHAGEGEILFNLSIDEDCWHYICWRAYDNFGNYDEDLEIDTPNKQEHWVDATPPNTFLPQQFECIKGENEYCIKTNELISLNVINSGTAPCIYPDYWGAFRIGVDDGTGNIQWYPDSGHHDYANYDSDDVWMFDYDEDGTAEYYYKYDESRPFYFTEECHHIVEFFGKDPLCNTEEKHIIDFYVDDQAPYIDKTVNEENCYQGEIYEKIFDEEVDTYCVRKDTVIEIDAWDLGCCEMLSKVEYRVWFDGSWGDWIDITNDLVFDYSFTDECKHLLQIRAEDCLGNIAYDNEVFYVDEKPPILTKEVGEPKCSHEDSNCGCLNEGDYCVTTDTEIILSAENDGCCIDTEITIEYRIDIWKYDDEVWNIGSWQTYTCPITFDSECKHRLTIRAYDCLENGMDDAYWDTEIFYVDNQEPWIDKEVGTPKCPNPDPDTDFCVTTDTEIYLMAGHDGCCPCGINFYYNVWTDTNSHNWINVNTLPVKMGEPYSGYYVFNFSEECHHHLDLKAVDCFGRTVYHNETFFVDDTFPEIEKTVGEPKCEHDDLNCGCLNEGDYCVTTETDITINAFDDGCCPSLTVEYRVWNDDSDTDWVIIDSLPFVYNFPDECEHRLDIKAYDCLGHVKYHNETFFVDNQEPWIDKEVGTPKCPNPDPDTDFCVTTDTEIYLMAGHDGCCPCGINFYYNVWTDTNSHNWINVNTLPVKMGEPYSGYYVFNFSEECHHHLDLKAVDCFGRTVYHNETFYVDDQAPYIEKTVREPNCYQGPFNNLNTIAFFDPGLVVSPNDIWCVTTDTEITIDAWDLGCCGVLENVSYRIWYDGSWGPWIDIMSYLDGDNDNGEDDYFFTFDKECNHILEIQARDCLGNTETDVELFYVDDTSPYILKGVDEPNCEGGVSNGLKNPGFETGDFTNWQIEAETDSVRVMTTDFYTSPFYGKYMARLGDDNSESSQPIGDNKISQIFTADGDTFSFGYNIFTYDYEGFNHFSYTLETADGTTVIEHYEQGAWGPSGDTSLKSTGWQMVNIDISGYEGQELKFTVNCAGTSDPFYSTWAYVDAHVDTWCVTTDTEITIDAWDLGCCGVLENVSYRIWYDGSWGPWIDILEDVENGEYIFTFDLECYHKLEIQARDCLGNTETDVETFYVDNQPPMFKKIVGEPNCSRCLVAHPVTVPLYTIDTEFPTGEVTKYTDEENVYFEIEIDENQQYTDTEFQLIISGYPGDGNNWLPQGSIAKIGIDTDGAYFTIADGGLDLNNNGIYETPHNKYGWWTNTEDEELPQGVIVEGEKGDFYFKVTIPNMWGCGQKIYWAVNVGATWPGHPDSSSHFAQYPHPETWDKWSCKGSFAEFKLGELEYCVTTDTPISIEAMNMGCCINEDITIEYKKWKVGDENCPEEWTTYDGPFTFDNECEHKLIIRAYDCLGNGKDDMFWDEETFYVDEQAPELTKTVGEPSFTDDEKVWWVTTETEINLTAEDQGCCPSDYVLIEYKIWYQGEWTDWIIYDGNFTFEQGCTHYLLVKVSDCLGNYMLDNETFIVHGPSGDDDPEIEITHPTLFDEPHCEKTLEVILEASDMETDSEDLDVRVWIPGGRRDAPTLWYDATHVSGDIFHTFIDIYKYQNGAELTLWAAVMDEEDNVEFAMPVPFTVCSTTMWDQWMQTGWNKLTLPYNSVGCDNSIKHVLSSINDGNFDKVYWYDEDNKVWIAREHTTEYGWIGSLSEINPGEEYWVHIQEGARFFTDTNGADVTIEYPVEGTTYEDELDEDIHGTAYDLETGVEEVKITIQDNETKEYWDGSGWTIDYTELEVDGTENWEYDDTEEITYDGRSGHKIIVTAMAKDYGSGCITYDTTWYNVTVITPALEFYKDIDIPEQSDNIELEVGSEARLHIFVYNIGNCDLYNIIVNDTMPSGLTYTPGTAYFSATGLVSYPTETINGDMITWDFNDYILEELTAIHIYIPVIVSETGIQENLAEVYAYHDEGMLTDSDTTTIIGMEGANNPPVITIDNPADGSEFSYDDTGGLTINGTAYDTETHVEIQNVSYAIYFTSGGINYYWNNSEIDWTQELCYYTPLQNGGDGTDSNPLVWEDAQEPCFGCYADETFYVHAIAYDQTGLMGEDTNSFTVTDMPA